MEKPKNGEKVQMIGATALHMSPCFPAFTLMTFSHRLSPVNIAAMEVLVLRRLFRIEAP